MIAFVAAFVIIQTIIIAVLVAAVMHCVEYKEFGTLNRRGGEVIWLLKGLVLSITGYDILVMDLDKLKQLNTIYGLAELDAKVKPVLLNTRRNDVVVRLAMQYFSGDEFVFVVKAGHGQGAAGRLLNDLKAISMTDGERAKLMELTNNEFDSFSATIIVKEGCRGMDLFARIPALEETLEHTKKDLGIRGQVVVVN